MWELSQKIGADFYFATTYHFWERGLNDNTNELFKIVKPEEVEIAVNFIKIRRI
ncbi:Mobile element protein [Microcystis aeruginosa NIES-2549]|uniref:Mobile element protein n=1 Tax=Microcystis aeruginosa NIES-2549 TaxID=1641812 RepID=A0A0F6RK78_MICAE|nr:Mobile element protein [Microcystis aeruginosa NIES-2549]AOC51992.1 Mobile element protein [Microcystis aeruginosa NIES-2481]